jgi:mannan polymerase II complex ANP1 subunit
MAKRMQFSVVGLPHYTIWHMYEPSVDDIRHMEEMEKQRAAKEAEEKKKREREQKIKDQFDDPGKEWENDKAKIRDMAKKEYVEKEMKKGNPITGADKAKS